MREIRQQCTTHSCTSLYTHMIIYASEEHAYPLGAAVIWSSWSTVAEFDAAVGEEEQDTKEEG